MRGGWLGQNQYEWGKTVKSAQNIGRSLTWTPSRHTWVQSEDLMWRHSLCTRCSYQLTVGDQSTHSLSSPVTCMVTKEMIWKNPICKHIVAISSHTDLSTLEDSLNIEYNVLVTCQAMLLACLSLARLSLSWSTGFSPFKGYLKFLGWCLCWLGGFNQTPLARDNNELGLDLGLPFLSKI